MFSSPMLHFGFSNKIKDATRKMRCIFKTKLLLSQPRERRILIKLIYIIFHKKIITNDVKWGLGNLHSQLSLDYAQGMGRW